MKINGKSLVLILVGILVAVGIWLNLRTDELSPVMNGAETSRIVREAPEFATPQGREGGGEPTSTSFVEELVRAIRSALSTIFSDTVALGFIALVVLAALLMRAVSRGVRMPAKVTVVPVEGAADEVSDYVESTTRSLKSLGFSHLLDFTMPELPHESFYRFMGSSEGKHTALISEIRARGLVEPARYVEFQTLLENGAKINTNNNPLPTPFIPPPHVFVDTYPDLKDLAMVYDKHLENEDRVILENPGPISLQRIEDFPARMSRDWREVIEYQAACGLLTRNPDDDDFYGTTRLFLRYLWMSLTARWPKN